jgi:SpoVK/Ycf46/Vps4 family AAA+-type ATPase
LARKIAPCIIFLDEIDVILGKRTGAENSQAVDSIKGEFMSMWDGMSTREVTDGGVPVCVLGATNRPQDIDPAFLRRMPRQFKIGLPDANQRGKKTLAWWAARNQNQHRLRAVFSVLLWT